MKYVVIAVMLALMPCVAVGHDSTGSHWHGNLYGTEYEHHQPVIKPQHDKECDSAVFGPWVNLEGDTLGFTYRFDSCLCYRRMIVECDSVWVDCDTTYQWTVKQPVYLTEGQMKILMQRFEYWEYLKTVPWPKSISLPNASPDER